jgi:basic membrane lipoprotein Med (substrate-binding protein (PBP1-ABC) superfamily)
MKLRIKNHTKILAFFLGLTLMIMPFFTSCDRDGGENGENQTTTTTEEPEVIIKVGFIYRGTLADSAHNLMFEAARFQLERNLGVETCYIESVFVSNYMEAVGVLHGRDVNIIVSTCPMFANITNRAAVEFRGIDFISFGGQTTMPNLTTFRPLLHQPAHVSGLAASFNSVNENFGIVSDTTMFNHEGVINAYIGGIKDLIGRDINAPVNYVNSHVREDVESAINDLVFNQGVEVVMLYLNSDYGIKHCERNNIKVVAYSMDLPALAPNNYIMGYYFNVIPYLTEQVQFIKNKMFTPTQTIGGMASGHTGLTQLNDNEEIIDPYTKVLTDLLVKELLIKDNIFSGLIRDNFGNIQVEYGYTLSETEILDVKWMELSATRIQRLSMPVTQIQFVPLIVRGEWGNTIPDHVLQPIATNESDEPSGQDEPSPVDTASPPDNTTPPEVNYAPVGANDDTTAEATTEEPAA